MKVFRGTVVSTKMKDTIVIEVTRRVPHPLYKKLLKRSTKHKVSAPGNTVVVGQVVRVVETRPISKDVHFKLMDEKAKTGEASVQPEVAKKQGRAKK